jgi:hypothetical protein
MIYDAETDWRARNGLLPLTSVWQSELEELPAWAAPEADRWGGYGFNSGSMGGDYGLPAYLPKDPPAGVPRAAGGEAPAAVPPLSAGAAPDSAGPSESALQGGPAEPTRLAGEDTLFRAGMWSDVLAYERAMTADAHVFIAERWDEATEYLSRLVRELS